MIYVTGVSPTNGMVWKITASGSAPTTYNFYTLSLTKVFGQILAQLNSLYIPGLVSGNDLFMMKLR